MQLSWSAPATNTPPVAGYEVFYAECGSDATKSGGTTTSASTTISVTIRTLDVTYFFVVAFSDADNTLPSAWSNIVANNMSKCSYMYK